MAVTGSITTRFIDETGLDLGKTLIEKDYLISVYPNIVNQLDTPMLMGWGGNSMANLGDNTLTNKSSPIQTIAYGSNWKQASCNEKHSGAVKADGTLWLWGDNQIGQLGDNTRTTRSSPVQTVAFGSNWKQVAIGGQYYSSAIKTDGTLWCWGNNADGQLGINSVTNLSSPQQTVAFGTNWKQISCGSTHTAAVKTDGTLWLWGSNLYGQLGDNSTTKRSSPVQTIALGTNWQQVSCGGSSHTAAIKADGTLWSWGNNTDGQLGDNTIVKRSSPVQTVAYGTNWKQVSCGYSTFSVKTDGTLWCWGYNYFGGLGDNTTTYKSSPVQTIAYGTNWKQVACAGTYAAGIKTDGTLWTWGYNGYGNLGDNTTTNRSSPVQTLIYGNLWKGVFIASGSPCIFAIKDGDF